MRRIIKIAVRFLHTKTALCDRKDTQSRFAVNAARSIVCVGTVDSLNSLEAIFVSMPHAALCVSGQHERDTLLQAFTCFNAARSIVCVGTWESYKKPCQFFVSMPHAALCVSGPAQHQVWGRFMRVSMPHAALCVSGHRVPQPLSRAG